MDIWIWAIVIVVALVVEFTTPEMVSIWFAIGALVALTLAAVGVQTWVQVVVFSTVSLALLLSLRKILAKYLTVKDEKTNADSFVGKTFVLTEPITLSTNGKISIADIEWAVTTEGKEELEKGQKVTIIEIKGNKFVVKGENK